MEDENFKYIIKVIRVKKSWTGDKGWADDGEPIFMQKTNYLDMEKLTQSINRSKEQTQIADILNGEANLLREMAGGE